MYSLDKIEVNINSIKQDKRTTHTTNQTPAYPKSVFFIRPCLCPCLPNSTPKVKPKTRASCFTLITLLSPSIRPTPPSPGFGFPTFACISVGPLPSTLAGASLTWGPALSYLTSYHSLKTGVPTPCLFFTERSKSPFKVIFLYREIKVIFQKCLKCKTIKNGYIIFLHKTPLAFHCPDSLISPFVV